jgi:hypothetical protein
MEYRIHGSGMELAYEPKDDIYRDGSPASSPLTIKSKTQSDRRDRNNEIKNLESLKAEQASNLLPSFREILGRIKAHIIINFSQKQKPGDLWSPELGSILRRPSRLANQVSVRCHVCDSCSLAAAPDPYCRVRLIPTLLDINKASTGGCVLCSVLERGFWEFIKYLEGDEEAPSNPLDTIVVQGGWAAPTFWKFRRGNSSIDLDFFSVSGIVFS